MIALNTARDRSVLCGAGDAAVDRTMLHAARADDEIVRALVARHTPVSEAVRAEDRAAGKAEGVQEGLLRGKAEAVLAVLAARRITVGDAERVRILGEQDPMELDHWLADAMTCAEVAELFTTRNQR